MKLRRVWIIAAAVCLVFAAVLTMPRRQNFEFLRGHVNVAEVFDYFNYPTSDRLVSTLYDMPEEFWQVVDRVDKELVPQGWWRVPGGKTSGVWFVRGSLANSIVVSTNYYGVPVIAVTRKATLADHIKERLGL